MKQVYVQLETLAPLSLRADHAAVGVDAAGYIAGNTVLGSLAAAHRLLYPEKRDEFEQFFLQEKIFYPNLYPASVDGGTSGQQDIRSPIYPLPQTAQSCKRSGGFFYPKTEINDSHGVRDTVIDWALFKSGMQSDASGQGFEPVDVLRAYRGCALCREPMDRFQGYYRRNEASKVMIATHTHATRLQTRIGVDRASGIAQSDIFYNQQVFDEGTTFWGEVKLLDDHLLKAFQAFMLDVGAAGLIRMGTGRTRGMGKVKIEVVESEIGAQERNTHFASRLQSFNELLNENIARRMPGYTQQNYFFTLTLHSPLILSDEFLRYRGTIDENVLREWLEIPVEGLGQVYQNATIKRVMGWQELWGTPRANEYAIDTGSVFLFRCDSLEQRALEALFRLEEQGVGERRAEGFGRICISDPFHKEVAPK